jgi:hypothetical protein
MHARAPQEPVEPAQEAAHRAAFDRARASLVALFDLISDPKRGDLDKVCVVCAQGAGWVVRPAPFPGHPPRCSVVWVVCDCSGRM